MWGTSGSVVTPGSRLDLQTLGILEIYGKVQEKLANLLTYQIKALCGVVIVETLFNYKGFGWTLVQAAGNNDIELLLSCSIAAVLVVLVTQLISDIGYVFLNPRIRIS